ncbi:conserved protein, unknown function [Hepatocystis sp. ex Piliocolobus tephrosceles]|nr:conserved protein, unknown function [Hepatocystis sp. ex Piliocolobus tephrosceles]
MKNYFDACIIDCDQPNINSNPSFPSTDLTNNYNTSTETNKAQTNKVQTNKVQTNTSVDLAELRLASLYKSFQSMDSLNKYEKSKKERVGGEQSSDFVDSGTSNFSNMCTFVNNNKNDEESSVSSIKPCDCNSIVDVNCFKQDEGNYKIMEAILYDQNNATCKIIYDKENNRFFDLNNQIYTHVKNNIYLNNSDNLFYEIDFANNVLVDNVKNELFKWGNFFIKEKYAPCKIIMKMCLGFNKFMYDLLKVDKYKTYYINKENIVEIIIK